MPHFIHQQLTMKEDAHLTEMETKAPGEKEYCTSHKATNLWSAGAGSDPRQCVSKLCPGLDLLGPGPPEPQVVSEGCFGLLIPACPLPDTA